MNNSNEKMRTRTRLCNNEQKKRMNVNIELIKEDSRRSCSGENEKKRRTQEEFC